MWGSGSLIRSSTWRSSSVSAPCISSSICLCSSPERSRTMRGSFCQALPIGCIRVFMTPSCSSAVTLESRCSGTLNSVSSLRREISRSWLRVKTSSETLVIRGSRVFEGVDVDPDRLVGDLVGLMNFDLGGRVAGGRLVGSRLDHGLCLLGFGSGGLLGTRRRGWGRSGNRCRGSGGLGRSFTERPLQLIQRNFTGTQRPLQYLWHQRAPRALLDRRLAE